MDTRGFGQFAVWFSCISGTFSFKLLLPADSLDGLIALVSSTASLPSSNKVIY
ncbi:hypothetical protein BO94DRAFT_118231 [Aspergillus sclerotioniger CBS 115572]|uniref:Uncharacterized protein n=1 Tax=Aspergillus sclerotioniger CBS 115572 TaxID=1450535 RepID=A0A317WFX6_9EURO|nr:hypothetical protein BO94DRAFT_118231 [Aspergillus sclerotioniger CBS 115572]PWY83090.1 hypothetical protein BO94DRAFT_118231 [Aspergillus sclerotioniger CBS 115572]